MPVGLPITGSILGCCPIRPMRSGGRQSERPISLKAAANGAERVLIETTEAEGAGLDMLEIERLAKFVLG